MAFEKRIPEGEAVEAAAMEVFARVAGWGGRFAAKRVKRILGKEVKKDARVLDVGTGPGTIPLYLSRSFPKTLFIGMDTSFDMLKSARSFSERLKTWLPLSAGNGETLPIKDNSMDVVMSFFALHHMDRPGFFLKESDRVLKPEGKLLILDFRRDMSSGLFFTLNGLWRLFFFFSAGRNGFEDSVRSAWRSEEIQGILREKGLNRFYVRVNPLELWVVSNGR